MIQNSLNLIIYCCYGRDKCFAGSTHNEEVLQFIFQENVFGLLHTSLCPTFSSDCISHATFVLLLSKSLQASCHATPCYALLLWYYYYQSLFRLHAMLRHATPCFFGTTTLKVSSGFMPCYAFASLVLLLSKSLQASCHATSCYSLSSYYYSHSKSLQASCWLFIQGTSLDGLASLKRPCLPQGMPCLRP
jgi:hypothetical protein